MRGSGRTTRMLQEALALAQSGRAVCVVFHSRLAFPTEPHYSELGIKFETPSSLGDFLDYNTMTLRGAHPNCVVLVDHYVLEQKFGAVLEMYLRYQPIIYVGRSDVIRIEDILNPGPAF